MSIDPPVPDQAAASVERGERESQLSAMFDGELPQAECELLARRIARDEALKRQWGRYALIGAVIREEPLRARRGAGGIVVGSAVAGRVALAMEHESTSVPAAGVREVAAGSALEVAERPESRWLRWGRPLGGLGIAAGVAALSVLLLQARTQSIESARLTAAAVNPDAPARDRTLAGQSASGSNAAGAGASGIEVVVAAPSSLGSAAAGWSAMGAAPAAARARTVSTREPRSYVVPMPSTDAAAMLSAPQLAKYVVAHSEFSGPMARRNTLSALIAADAAADALVEAEAAAAASASAAARNRGGGPAPAPIVTPAEVSR